VGEESFVTPAGSFARALVEGEPIATQDASSNWMNASGLAGYEGPWCPGPFAESTHGLQHVVGDSGHESLAVNLPQPSQTGTGPTQPVKGSESAFHRSLASLHFSLE
jgi:hypothetical protein